MSEINWRMPQPGQRPEAKLWPPLTVADVAEALNQPEQRQLRQRMTELITQIVAPNVAGALIQVALYRNDDSLVWWVWAAQVAPSDVQDNWRKR